MSAKWIRSKKWDDQFFPSWAWPAKAVLRAFSSIWLAVILLCLVAIYGVLASVPIGLLALIPTKLVYAATVLAAVGVVAVLPIVLVRRVWRSASPMRFVLTVVGGVALTVLAWHLWQTYVWPSLHWDPAKQTGLRFFGDFIERYSSTTLRRLPGMEMSELEFYSWWPLQVILLAFVVNMMTATVRRIEFSFVNLGVLTVHTGIVTIALGSAYYSGMKKEGDTLLLAGEPGADGKPTPGPPVRNFYDNTATVLYIRQEGRVWEMRPLNPPRYNDYGLTAHLASATDSARRVLKPDEPLLNGDEGRTLERPIDVYPGVTPIIDGDLQLRLVGYASYAEPGKDWVKATPAAGQSVVPARFARLEIAAKPASETGKRTGFAFYFLPTRPQDRLGETEAFGLEYTLGMSDQRFADLSQPMADLPTGDEAKHAVVVEIPRAGGEPFRAVVALDAPGRVTKLGDTGWSIELKSLHEQPPFPIVTKGFENAQSSVAIVKVTPPADRGEGNKPFERWLYHRFPEIAQDLSDELNERGMPRRSAPDAGIRLAYLDNTKLQVYLDERADQSVRAIIRTPGKAPRVVEGVAAAGRIENILPGLNLQLLDRWDHVEETSVPTIVPPDQREKENLGTHGKAQVCIEIASSTLKSADGKPWSRRLWVPFSKYLGVDAQALRSITLPDGRQFQLAFGRQAHELPGFMVQLLDFEMIPYEHRGAPRDYKSIVRVVPDHTQGEVVKFAAYEHITELNAPLQAPFIWSDKRGWLANAAGTLLSRLNPRQFKFSQAGWDPTTWNRTQEMVDRGELPRPYASFTILGVGNNPGIHVIAFGGILMSVGIPWAFYVKPWLIKRRKAKLQEMLAAAPPRQRRGQAASEPAPDAGPTPSPAVPTEVGANR